MAKAKKKMKGKSAKRAPKKIKKMAKPTKKKATKKKTAKKKVSATPKGYHSITPYLIVNNAAQAIEFYRKVFGAKEVMRMSHQDNRIAHAELVIGDAKIMLADEYPEMNARGPQALGGTPVFIHLYIKDVDATVEKAVNAGAKLLRPIQNMFYGDRLGVVEDPHGHQWSISTHIEDVTPAQMKKRAETFAQ